MFSRHIANLLPFYGRSREPVIRAGVHTGAELLVFDPLHRSDAVEDAHMLILEPTGAEEIGTAGVSA